MNEATLKQKQLIDTLCKELEIEVPRNSLTKQEADSFIRELIAKANNGDKAESNLNKEYPISFQAFVKAACGLYANRTDKTFKDVLREVKEAY